MGPNLGQLVAQRAVHHALARRAVDIDMAGNCQNRMTSDRTLFCLQINS